MKKLLLLTALCFSIRSEYMSQMGQDRYLNENYFKSKKNGFFVDIGAHDGVSCSNTLFFENLGWHGVCFEPHPKFFGKLREARSCTCINACVSPQEGIVEFIAVEGYPHMLSGMKETYDPRHFQRLLLEIQLKGGAYSIIKVPSVTFNKTLEHENVYQIDYLSLDTEGGELEILKSIDFNRFKVFSMSVENNFKDPQIRIFLESQGFTYITMLEDLDEIYINTRHAFH